MPILQCRPATLSTMQNTSARSSTEGTETPQEQILIVEDYHEKPYKEMDFPSAKSRSMSLTPRSKSKLRINTYSRTELHDRYMSSEEEPSPSPDGEESHDEELKHKVSVKFTDEPSDNLTVSECTAEIAIAVPIFSLGRPKLVNITNIAPMRKRKQRIPKSQAPHAASKSLAPRMPTVADENTAFPANEAAEVITSPALIAPRQSSRRKENRLALTAPDSWLPNEEAPPSDDEHYFPVLDVRRTPSYHDYDPYSLVPPRLVASGKVSRDRASSGSSTANGSWRGLTRSLSLAKKQHSHQQVAKKPKMIARGANERENTPVIPPFPFEGGFA